MSINTVRDKVKKFLREALEVKDHDGEIRIVGMENTGEGWTAEAEVAERNATLPGHQVFEKKYYVVKLNSDLEVSSYKQEKGIGEQGEE